MKEDIILLTFNSNIMSPNYFCLCENMSYYHSAHKDNNKKTVYSKSGLDSNDIKTVIEERLSENESQPLKLTDEQKNYLKEKYDLEEMTFPINYTSSSVTDSFMKDLYER